MTDPNAPLAVVPNGVVKQRITGSLYVEFEGGQLRSYPVGWSVEAIVRHETELARAGEQGVPP